MRGEGSFHKIISGIKKCKQAQIPVGIAVTVSKINIKELDQIIQLADSLHVDEIEMSEVEARGNALKESNLLLNQAELNEFREFCLKQIIVNEKFRKGMGYHNRQGMEEGYLKKYCCKGGIITSFINAKGELYPCYLFANFDEAKIGDVTQDSIIRLWEKSDFLDKIRDTTIDKIKSCVQCECYKDCNGGCRAKAYENTGLLDGPMTEEFCTSTKYIKKKYSIVS